jgi:N4-gp56 family major capsid protein
MNKQEIVMNAIDSNGFQSTATAAGYINPEIWNKQVLAFLEANLVVTPLGKEYNDLLGAPGDTLNITINSTPVAAAAVDESADVSITAYATTQVVFQPTEYAFAYQLSDKEARRAFYDVAMDMAKKIGYALALKRDTVAVSLLQTNAGNTVVANNVVASNIASSDTIDFDDIVKAATEIRKDKLVPKYLVVSPGQLGDLSKSTLFATTLPQGGDATNVLGGKIGRVYGMDVFWSTQISPTANRSKAIMLGVDQFGEAAFGICKKSLPTVRSERYERGRYTDFVGVEEYDMEILRANGVCTIESYDA